MLVQCSFNNEFTQGGIIYSAFVLYMVVVYFFFWRRFIIDMEEELWKTKSILCVLSPELVMAIEPIRTFILNNSSTVYLTKSSTK